MSVAGILSEKDLRVSMITKMAKCQGEPVFAPVLSYLNAP